MPPINVIARWDKIDDGETAPVALLTDWGILGDDENENVGLFQKANDDVAAAGGGNILCPPGIYRSGAFKQSSDVGFIGVNQQGAAHLTVFKPVASIPANTPFITNKNLIFTSGIRADRNVWTKRIHFDGSLRKWVKWLSKANGLTVIGNPASDYVAGTGALASGITAPVFDAVLTAAGVSRVTVIDGGGGFGGHPTFPYLADHVPLKFTGGGGSGAAGLGIINKLTGKISSCFIQQAGAGYTSKPTVTTMGGYADIALLVDPTVDRRNPNYYVQGPCILMQKVDGGGVALCSFADYENTVIMTLGCRRFRTAHNIYERTGKDDGGFPTEFHGNFGVASTLKYYAPGDSFRSFGSLFTDLNRLAVTMGCARGGKCFDHTVTNSGESGFFVPVGNEEFGETEIFNVAVNGVRMTDIVASAAEIHALRTRLHDFTFSNSEDAALSLYGARESVVSDGVIANAYGGPAFYPFGPFSERYGFGRYRVPLAGTARPMAGGSYMTLGRGFGIANSDLLVERVMITDDRPSHPATVVKQLSPLPDVRGDHTRVRLNTVINNNPQSENIQMLTEPVSSMWMPSGLQFERNGVMNP